MDRSWRLDDEEDEEGLEGDEDEAAGERKEVRGGRDAVILVIDASDKMLKKVSTEDGEEEEEPFRTAIKCCHSHMRSKIIASEADLMAIVVYGTREHLDCDFDNISIMQELAPPSAAKIKQLEEMKASPSLSGFEQKFGHGHEATMRDVLWLCLMMFSKSGTTLAQKKVLLFTNEDNPHPGDDGKLRLAMRTSKDLAEAGAKLSLIAMGQEFSTSHFYRDILQLHHNYDPSDSNSEFGFADGIGVESYTEIMKVIRRRDFKKRTLGRMHMHIGPGLKLGVSTFVLAREVKRPYAIKVNRSTNQPVQNKTTLYNSESGELLLPSEVRVAQKLANQDIKFSSVELKSIKTFTSSPALHLVGFRPTSQLKPHMYLKPSNFLYPEETMVKGSRRLFAALLRNCASRNMSPICYMIPRKISYPSMVALIPQVESGSDDVGSSGFHVVFLPYADDVRQVPLDETQCASADDNQVDAAKRIVKRLRFKYQPELFPDPQLQKHWRNIEALALDRDTVDDEDDEEFQDHTLQDEEAVRKRLDKEANDFMEAVFPEGIGNQVGKRRGKAAGDGNSPAAKRSRRPAGEIDVEAEARAGRANKLTVDQLKSYLLGEGCRIAGKRKADLIQELYTYLKIDPVQ